MAKDRFGAFMNGFRVHQVRRNIRLEFPHISNKVGDFDEALRAVPKCSDVKAEVLRYYQFRGYQKEVGKRFDFMGSSECEEVCEEEESLTTRLCSGSKKERGNGRLEEPCILIHCYSPAEDDNRNASKYKAGGSYWRKRVGETPNGHHTKDEDGEFDSRRTSETQIYHVEHMKDFSDEGRNAFANFIMTWGLPNTQLSKADKNKIVRERQKNGKKHVTQWQEIYGAILRQAQKVEDFCDKRVTTKEMTIFYQRKDTEDNKSKSDSRSFKIMPRSNEEEVVLGWNGAMVTVQKLDIDQVMHNLGRDGTKELRDLFSKTCNEAILEKDYHEEP